MSAIRFLHIREPGGTERTVPLAAEPVVLGRDDECTVPVGSPFVSRRHARIEPSSDGAVLVDLGSHNGCLVNGERAPRTAPLRPGDVITIADVTVECLGVTPRTAKTRTLVRPAPAVPPAAPGSPAEAPPPPAAPEVGLRIDPRTLQVWVDDALLRRRLSAQEFALLSVLHAHQDRVCTRRELGDAIWGRHTWDPNLLHRLVRRLKEKIEPQPQEPRFLHTVPWVGYRLTACLVCEPPGA